jgi:predicted transcriptional regulator
VNVETQLQQLGFGEYEAKAYVALLQRSPLNGYELAKQSGLPRANIYGVLQKLEERGAVVRLDLPEGTRYAPVQPAELTERLGNRYQEALDAARDSLAGITGSAEEEYIWNARGYSTVMEHAHAMIDAAQDRLLIAVWPQEAAALRRNIDRAVERGVELTTLCMAACAVECGNCEGNLFRYRVKPEDQTRWLVIVPDSAEMLAGEIGPGESALAVRTRQRLFVDLAGWYMRHTIALSTVLTDLGTRLEDLLAPQTLSVLKSIGPGGLNTGWLDYMRQVLSQGAALEAKQ